jgi:hypothetical protein
VISEQAARSSSEALQAGPLDVTSRPSPQQIHAARATEREERRRPTKMTKLLSLITFDLITFNYLLVTNSLFFFDYQ